jgi:hypothetical protein
MAVPVGAEAFLEAGLIPNSLIPILQYQLECAEKGQEPDLKKMYDDLLKQDDGAADMLRMANAVTVHCVTAPPVAAAVLPGMPRDPNILYVDQVDFDDKLFIMQFAMGGTRDLEQFRQQQVAHVALVQQGRGESPAAE